MNSLNLSRSRCLLSSYILPKARLFHTTAPALKKHPLAVKKLNLAKREARKIAEAASQPSPVIPSNLKTPFLESLHTTQSARESDDLQKYVRPQDERFMFVFAPRVVAGGEGDGWEDASDAGRNAAKSAKLLEAIVGLRNGNRADVQKWNIGKALEWFRRDEHDTGSPEVQAAVWTVRILALHEHLEENRNDKHNYLQLRAMVMKRAKLLKYLKRTDSGRYAKLLKDLGLEARAIEGEINVKMPPPKI